MKFLLLTFTNKAVQQEMVARVAKFLERYCKADYGRELFTLFHINF